MQTMYIIIYIYLKILFIFLSVIKYIMRHIVMNGTL